MANFPPRAGSGNQPSSQPTGQPDSGSPTANPVQTTSGTVTGMRTAGVRPCPSCGALINVHATVCPNCGEQFATKEKTIRCRRCRHRASSSLVVCPHCGRDLQPATSRWLTWGLPLLAVLLLSSVLVLRAGRGGDPASWAQAQVDRIVRLVAALGSRLQPDVTVSMIPAGQDPNDPLVSQAAQAGAVLSAVPASNQPAVVDVVDISAESSTSGSPAGSGIQSGTDNAPLVEVAVAVTATNGVSDTSLTPAPTEGAPAEPTATVTAPPPTATAEPTASATATQAATSTATRTATSTATAKPAATEALGYAPSASETVTNTATKSAAGTATHGATLATTAVLTRTIAVSAAAATAGTPTPVLTQAVSLLGLATPTPIPVQPTVPPTLAATATPAVLAVYEVRRGDTLYEIATEYDVTVEDLLAANGLAEDDVYTIQPGDELNIPAPTPEGAPTATPAPAPATYTVRPGDTMLAIALRSDVTVEDLLAANGMTINDARTLQPGDELVIPGTEGAATATPAATATGAASSATTPAPENSVRVDAPRLRSPENGTAVSCSGQSALTWLQVPSVRPTDLYMVHLGYVNSIGSDGNEEIIWVISQQRPVSATSWQLDNDLCGLAPNTASKQWRWFVDVVETTTEGLRSVSPASPVWGFTWQ